MIQPDIIFKKLRMKCLVLSLRGSYHTSQFTAFLSLGEERLRFNGFSSFRSFARFEMLNSYKLYILLHFYCVMCTALETHFVLMS